MERAARSERLEALRAPAVIAGVGGLILCVAGGALDRRGFFESYLVGYMFWLAIPLGSLAILMLHHMVGGNWGFAIRRFLEAATRTFPLMAVLFVPIVLGLDALYPWLDEELLAEEPLLAHKTPFLNRGFFLARAGFYFASWIGLSFLLNRWSHAQDRNRDKALLRRLQIVSAAGLVLFGLTASFSSIDWVMSLEPLWFSTIYGGIYIVGDSLTALIASIVLLALARGEEPLASVVGPKHFHDLGNLLLAFLMLWAYISFSQYLIIWSGNTAEEVPWYLRRQEGIWQLTAAALMVFHFAVPFAILLPRGTKRRAKRLAALAAGLLVMRWVELVWLIRPAFGADLHGVSHAAEEGVAHGGASAAAGHAAGAGLSWLDVATTVCIGGFWFAFFVTALGRRPLLVAADPRFTTAGNGAATASGHGERSAAAHE